MSTTSIPSWNTYPNGIRIRDARTLAHVISSLVWFDFSCVSVVYLGHRFLFFALLYRRYTVLNIRSGCNPLFVVDVIPYVLITRAFKSDWNWNWNKPAIVDVIPYVLITRAFKSNWNWNWNKSAIRLPACQVTHPIKNESEHGIRMAAMA